MTQGACFAGFALWLFATAAAWAQPGNQPEPRGLVRHVVAIYDKDDDHKLLGSGAVVSTTGLILTAKHILALEKLEHQSVPNLRVAVQVRAESNTALHPAELVAVHPIYDVAILKVDWPLKVVPLYVGSRDLDETWSWTAIGHNAGAASPQLFFEKSGTSSELTVRAGRWVIDRFVATGMSGGPLIVGNTIIGVISFADNSAYIDPVTPALAYFNLLGVLSRPLEGDPKRRAFSDWEDHIGTLAMKVRDYEALLDRIQIDHQWYCRLERRGAGAGAGDEGNMVLVIGHRKRMNFQPEFEARLSLELRATLSTRHGQDRDVTVTDFEFKPIDVREVAFTSVFDQLRSELRSVVPADEVDAYLPTRLEANLQVTGIWSEKLFGDGTGEAHRCCVLELPGSSGEQIARVCEPTPEIESARTDHE